MRWLLTASLDEMAARDQSREQLDECTDGGCIHSSPTRGARDLPDCLMLQLESRNAKGSVAWQIVATTYGCSRPPYRELAKGFGPPREQLKSR